jgi:hypothetical protein
MTSVPPFTFIRKDQNSHLHVGSVALINRNLFRNIKEYHLLAKSHIDPGYKHNHQSNHMLFDIQVRWDRSTVHLEVSHRLDFQDKVYQHNNSLIQLLDLGDILHLRMLGCLGNHRHYHTEL